jgi:hypothetical protein
MRRIDIWTVAGFIPLLFLIFVVLLLGGGSSPTEPALASSAQSSSTAMEQYHEVITESPMQAAGQGRGECSLTFDDTLTLIGTVRCVH